MVSAAPVRQAGGRAHTRPPGAARRRCGRGRGRKRPRTPRGRARRGPGSARRAARPPRLGAGARPGLARLRRRASRLQRALRRRASARRRARERREGRAGRDRLGPAERRGDHSSLGRPQLRRLVDRHRRCRRLARIAGHPPRGEERRSRSGAEADRRLRPPGRQGPDHPGRVVRDRRTRRACPRRRHRPRVEEARHDRGRRPVAADRDRRRTAAHLRRAAQRRPLLGLPRRRRPQLRDRHRLPASGIAGRQRGLLLRHLAVVGRPDDHPCLAALGAECDRRPDDTVPPRPGRPDRRFRSSASTSARRSTSRGCSRR